MSRDSGKCGSDGVQGDPGVGGHLPAVRVAGAGAAELGDDGEQVAAEHLLGAAARTPLSSAHSRQTVHRASTGTLHVGPVVQRSRTNALVGEAVSCMVVTASWLEAGSVIRPMR